VGLKKSARKPWLKKPWCLPEASTELVASREDVLEVYAEPYDPSRPKVNVDETTKQLIKETRIPLPAQAGQPQRFDDEDERHGTRHLCLFVEPQAGRRHVQVTEQRTKGDFAHAMQWLVEIGYPDATVIRGVLDNLNTHKIASLYEAFAPAEARRLARKLELHYTPKHGSGLHMAEIACRVLQQQCLDRRIPDEDTLKHAIAAWEHQRNAEQATIDWRFSVTDARKKLERLYPSLPA
jgi:DDE superfamily endonuclease